MTAAPVRTLTGGRISCVLGQRAQVAVFEHRLNAASKAAVSAVAFLPAHASRRPQGQHRHPIGASTTDEPAVALY